MMTIERKNLTCVPSLRVGQSIDATDAEMNHLLREIGKPGNGCEVTVGRDTEKRTGILEFGHYEDTTSHQIEFDSRGQFVRVRVPIHCDVVIEKYTTV